MKKIKRIIMLILLTLTITGCVKMEISMDINKDKSMNLGIIQAIDNSLLEGTDASSLMEEEEKKELEDQGFKVETYTEDNMTGYKITKEVKNIDEISTENDMTADLGTSALADNEYMFTVKKGLFKNTYKAVLKNSDTDELDESLNSGLTDDTTEDDFTNDEDYLYDDTTDYTDDYLTDEDYTYDTTEDDYTNSGIADFDYTTLMSSMDLKMKVNLPYKALSNNASLVENDGTTLTWDLMSFQDDTIEFEFELYNTTNIIIVVVAGILVIVLLIVLIIKKQSKKNKNNVVAPTNNEVTPNTNEVQPTNNTPLDQNQQLQNQVSPEQPTMTTPVETNTITTPQEQPLPNNNNNIDLPAKEIQPPVENVVNQNPAQQSINTPMELNTNNTETTNPGFTTPDQNLMTSFNMVNETANQPTNNIVQPNNNIFESQQVMPQAPLTPPAPELNTQPTNDVNVVQEMPQPISLETVNNNQPQPYDIFSMNMNNNSNMNNEQPLPNNNNNIEQSNQYNSILPDQNTNK